jgi:hypothetical protein
MDIDHANENDLPDAGTPSPPSSRGQTTLVSPTLSPQSRQALQTSGASDMVQENMDIDHAGSDSSSQNLPAPSDSPDRPTVSSATAFSPRLQQISQRNDGDVIHLSGMGGDAIGHLKAFVECYMSDVCHFAVYLCGLCELTVIVDG